MSDKKISQLTAATTADGTEPLPIVQSGETKKATGKVVVSGAVSDLAQTWNAAGTTFTGLKLNVTDTASASGSLLLDVQKGGTSGFVLDKNFNLALNSPYAAYTADINGSAAVNGNAVLRQLYNAGGNNLLTYSEQFDNAAWTKEQGAITQNSVVAPDGTTTADVFTGNGTDGVLRQADASAPAGDYTASVWLKVPSGTLVTRLGISNGAGSNVNNSIITVTTSWQRFTFTTNRTATGVGLYVGGYNSIANGVAIHIWGAQLERGSIASPYTATTTAAVTTANRIFQGAGTAAAPSLTYNADTATGQFQPAVSSLGWSTAGTERLRLDSSGNLGLGTSTFGTSAAGVFAVKNGTAPTTGVADVLQIYSSDVSAGNTTLSIYTEGTPVSDSTDNAVTKKIAVRINGTLYYLLADTDNS